MIINPNKMRPYSNFALNFDTFVNEIKFPKLKRLQNVTSIFHNDTLDLKYISHVNEIIHKICLIQKQSPL